MRRYLTGKGQNKRIQKLFAASRNYADFTVVSASSSHDQERQRRTRGVRQGEANEGHSRRTRSPRLQINSSKGVNEKSLTPIRWSGTSILVLKKLS